MSNETAGSNSGWHSSLSAAKDVPFGRNKLIFPFSSRAALCAFTFYNCREAELNVDGNNLLWWNYSVTSFVLDAWIIFDAIVMLGETRWNELFLNSLGRKFDNAANSKRPGVSGPQCIGEKFIMISLTGTILFHNKPEKLQFTQLTPLVSWISM